MRVGVVRGVEKGKQQANCVQVLTHLLGEATRAKAAWGFKAVLSAPCFRAGGLLAGLAAEGLAAASMALSCCMEAERLGCALAVGLWLESYCFLP